jgi:predicted flap endonuclease-1-like 5' DNA nuclease
MSSRTLAIVLIALGAAGLVIFALADAIGFTQPNVFDSAQTIGVVIGALLLLIGIGLLANTGQEEAAPAAQAVKETQAEPAKTATPPASAEKDDLTRIEGIGPKLQSVLHAAGITTYQKLAAETPDNIKRVVQAGGFKAPFNPETWPQQAGLAAKGDWGELEALQGELKGGRAS